MIIINTDDVGRSASETDAGAELVRRRRLTSVSAMQTCRDEEVSRSPRSGIGSLDAGRERLRIAPSVEVDGVDEQSWNDLSAGFADYNIYQSWPYEEIKAGNGHLSHLLLREHSRVIAAAQLRVIPIPYSKVSVAYARWGPLWRPRDHESDLRIFQQAVRALRAEYVERRGFILRILPRVADEANGAVRAILEQEGYMVRPSAGGATLLLDMRSSLDELYRGLHHKWRYNLNKARKQNLELIDGEEERLFLEFERIYDEMLDRKRFTSFTDVKQLKDVQRRLPPAHRMRVFLLKVAGEVCAGGVCSDLGDTALYLFGATNNRGTKTYGSYMVHWSMVAWAKARGCHTYDLNGVDPIRNTGGYQFKRQLAHTHGHHTSFVGQFDAYPNLAAKALVSAGDPLRLKLRNGRRMLRRVFAPALKLIRVLLLAGPAIGARQTAEELVVMFLI